MNHRSLVPLNALRAFEAAGRHLSFIEAANELHVTPAAVSHHIKMLEDFIGTPLFVRRHRSIELTEAGKICLSPLQHGFHQIESIVLRLRSAHNDGPLRVRVGQCFAAKWLLPRLDAFQKRHPDIEIQVSVSSQIYEFRFEEMDVMIRLRAGEFSGFTVEPILTEMVFPVCSPAFLERFGPFHTPQDLLRQPLLHDDNLKTVSTFPTWPMWFRALGIDGVEATGGHRFDSSPMVVDATIESRGISLGRSALVERDLAAGRLVRLFDWTYPTTHDYFIIYSNAALKARKIQLFRDWILSEAANSVVSPLPAPVLTVMRGSDDRAAVRRSH